MSLSDSTTEEVKQKFGRHGTDTGSPEVQIALITQRLEYLAAHVKSHPMDRHSQRGLIKLVSKRKRLLKYLSQDRHAAYLKTIGDLNLRK